MIGVGKCCVVTTSKFMQSFKKKQWNYHIVSKAGCVMPHSHQKLPVFHVYHVIMHINTKNIILSMFIQNVEWILFPWLTNTSKLVNTNMSECLFLALLYLFDHTSDKSINIIILSKEFYKLHFRAHQVPAKYKIDVNKLGNHHSYQCHSTRHAFNKQEST